MRIGIDITPLQNGHRKRGVGEYARHLINHLTQIDKKNEYFFFGCSEEIEGLPLDADNVSVIKTVNKKTTDGALSRVKWHQHDLPKNAKKHDVEVLHILALSNEPTIPIISSAKLVVTIHDLKSLIFPKIYLDKYRKKMTYGAMIRSVKKTDHIITDSLNSKKDIKERLRISEDEISVVSLGVNPDFLLSDDRRSFDEAAIRNKYNIPEEFILYAGAIEPSKNISTLLSSYESLLAEGFLPCLVLVGVKDPAYFSSLKDRFDGLIGRNVLFLDFVPTDDLMKLYDLAKFFVYPSIYEGFGLPVLEAMATGTPVIASNSSSIPEVTGDCAVLFDPLNKEELKDALLSLNNNSELREKMKIKGIERAREFDWLKCAKSTLDIYQSLAGEK